MIKSKGHVVVLHGDEMAEVAFEHMLDRFVRKRIQIQLHEIDLSAKNRLRTNGKVVDEAIKALLTHKVGLKNAGITVNQKQLAQLSKDLLEEGVAIDISKLDKLATKSPNGAIRKGINGNIFREDIPFSNLKRVYTYWKDKEIEVYTMDKGGMRDAFAKQVHHKGELSLYTENNAGKQTLLHKRLVEKETIILVAHTSIAAVREWADGFFQKALDFKADAYMALKDTVMPGYDGIMKQEVEELFVQKYAESFKRQGLSYYYGLIDAQAAFMVTNPPKKAIWGIPDNNMGRKMAALVQALRQNDMANKPCRITVSRMSAGGGDQYASYNGSSEEAGKMVLKLGDETLLTQAINPGDPLLLMSNHPEDIKKWFIQTLEDAQGKGQEVVMGVDRSNAYGQAAADTITHVWEKHKKTYQNIPSMVLVTPEEQLIAMITDPAADGCYACLNMDGDVYSDIAAALGGSLATASSIIASVDGIMLYEAPHGTAPDLYQRYLQSGGKESFFNPSALIYALANALSKVAQNSKQEQELQHYAQALKQAVINTVAEGYITPDIKGKTTHPENEKVLNLPDYLEQVEKRLNALLS